MKINITLIALTFSCLCAPPEDYVIRRDVLPGRNIFGPQGTVYMRRDSFDIECFPDGYMSIPVSENRVLETVVQQVKYGADETEQDLPAGFSISIERPGRIYGFLEEADRRYGLEIFMFLIYRGQQLLEASTRDPRNMQTVYSLLTRVAANLPMRLADLRPSLLPNALEHDRARIDDFFAAQVGADENRFRAMVEELKNQISPTRSDRWFKEVLKGYAIGYVEYKIMGPETSDEDLHKSLKKIISLTGASCNINGYDVDVSKDWSDEKFFTLTEPERDPGQSSREIKIHVSELPVLQTVLQVLRYLANPQTEMVDLRNLPDGFSIRVYRCSFFRGNTMANATELSYDDYLAQPIDTPVNLEYVINYNDKEILSFSKSHDDDRNPNNLLSRLVAALRGLLNADHANPY